MAKNKYIPKNYAHIYVCMCVFAVEPKRTPNFFFFSTKSLYIDTYTQMYVDDDASTSHSCRVVWSFKRFSLNISLHSCKCLLKAVFLFLQLMCVKSKFNFVLLAKLFYFIQYSVFFSLKLNYLNCLF